jgi:hypothetical protein
MRPAAEPACAHCRRLPAAAPPTTDNIPRRSSPAEQSIFAPAKLETVSKLRLFEGRGNKFREIKSESEPQRRSDSQVVEFCSAAYVTLRSTWLGFSDGTQLGLKQIEI